METCSVDSERQPWRYCWRLVWMELKEEPNYIWIFTENTNRMSKGVGIIGVENIM